MNHHRRRPRRVLSAAGFLVVLVGEWSAAGGFRAPEAAAGFVLAGRAIPPATIVIPSRAGAVDRRAAEILQSAVRAMGGVTLPIVEKARPGRAREVAIGFTGHDVPRAVMTAAAGLGEDAFVVATAGRRFWRSPWRASRRRWPRSRTGTSGR